MEFMQFHPTVLYIAGGSRSLITEAMRGEGARLIDSTGRRFMPDYDERAELAPRDVVSQAIVAQMEKTRQPSVFLDLSHLDAGARAQAVSRHRADVCRVRHRHRDRSDSRAARRALHDRRRDGRSRRPHDGARLVGGGRSDEQRTARRESAGVEQFAGRTGVRRACRAQARRRPRWRRPIRIARFRWRTQPSSRTAEPLDLADIRNSLKSLMWRAAGVRRDGPQLAEAARNDSPLVRLRAVAAVRRPGRLGTAEHAHGGQPDGRGGTGPRGVARRASADRFPRDGRRALAAASGVRAAGG